MAGNGDIMDGIEPCRTCGIFYLTASNFLRKIYDSSSEEQDLSNIRTELSAWNIEINQNDGLPQYICTCCILEFQKLFKFRDLCVELQTQWRHFYQIKEENKIYIKKELPDDDEKTENVCDFIYVDDLSDSEFTRGEGGIFPTFNISHVPIKEEPTDQNQVHNDALICTEKGTFTSTALVGTVEASEETNQTIDIIQLNSSNPNVLDSPKQQIMDETVSENNSIQIEKELDTPVECNLCLHVSANLDQHRLHMQRIHEVKDMSCHICGKQFKNSTATRLKFHLKWHRISKHIKCAQCGFFCDSRETLKEHVRAMHSKIECKTCGKRVLGKKMKIHMRTHEIRTWPCSYCNDVFQTENVLEEHIWDVHANEETEPPVLVEEGNSSIRSPDEEYLPCNLCDQLYPTQLELNAHKLESHLMQNVTNAETCIGTDLQTDQFNYQDPNDILDIPITNLQDTINETVSSGCGVKETKPSPLPEQQPQVTNSNSSNAFTQVISSDEERGGDEMPTTTRKEFDCPKCPQTFASTTDLCFHFQEHVEKSGHDCHICGKSFELKFSLNRHLKKHKSP